VLQNNTVVSFLCSLVDTTVGKFGLIILVQAREEQGPQH